MSDLVSSLYVLVFSPFNEIDPLDGESKRPIFCKRVVLPLPEGPIIATVSPDSMINLKNCKLDYVEIDKGVYEFIFLNPNDPAYVPPDEKLDDNVTHDL